MYSSSTAAFGFYPIDCSLPLSCPWNFIEIVPFPVPPPKKEELGFMPITDAFNFPLFLVPPIFMELEMVIRYTH
jgi:hypothetical protein